MFSKGFRVRKTTRNQGRITRKHNEMSSSQLQTLLKEAMERIEEDNKEKEEEEKVSFF